MKNIKKLIAYVFIILAVLSVGIKTYADTEEDLKNLRDELDVQIANTSTEIAGIKEKMTSSLEQINRLNVQIREYEETLATATDKLDELNAELAEKKAQLNDATEKYNKQKKIVENRLIAIYESSRTTYLDILLGSTSLSDFLTKYYILEELAEYDNKLLKSLDHYETAVAIASNVTETQRDEVENTKDYLEAKTDAMEVLIEDKNNLVVNLSQEEIELNEQLEQFEQDKKDIEKKLIELARQKALARSMTPSQSGYISPLPGRTKADITTGYHGYSGHTGVDFAVPLGTEVVAVKSGTVVISDALRYANGNYRSYGEYIVIDHDDGTMTLYAHGTPDSRMVQEGDKVTQRTSDNAIRYNWKFNRTTFTF